MNTKFRNVYGNVENLKKNKTIIMCNHYDGKDFFVLFDLYNKNNFKNSLCTIVKSDLVGAKDHKNLLSDFFYYLKTAFFNSLYFIPYKRGDKEDGNNVKNIISTTLCSNKNILVFPEGTVRRDGIPKDFRHGIFQLAIEEKANILPITMKYIKGEGTERNDPVILFSWFNNEVDIYIHDLITPEKNVFYLKNDFISLKEKVYHIVRSPFQNFTVSLEESK